MAKKTWQIYRGDEADIGTLAEGEMYFCTDSFKLFIGDGATNHEIGSTGSTGTAGTLDFDTDGTLAHNGDDRIATQKATKTYVDSSIATAVAGLLDLKGGTDCSANPNYPAALKGDAYYATVAGKIGGASGTSVDVGDVFVANADNAGGTQASVGSSWFIIEHNLAGAILSGSSAGGDLTGTFPNPTIDANKVTDAKFRQSAACSIVGRSANSTGNVADISINADGKFLVRRSGALTGDALGASDLPAYSGLTSVVATADDTIPEYSATDSANRKITIRKLAGLIDPAANDFVLSLVSMIAVPQSDQVGKTSIYLTSRFSQGGSSDSPKMALWDGTQWQVYYSQEVNYDLNGYTLTSGTNYDIFAYTSGGAIALEHVAWTSDTARATSLVSKDGTLVKSGDATKRYIGTFRATGSHTTEDSAKRRFVWNAYHRQPKKLKATLPGTTYNYSTATMRSANGNTTVGEGRFEVVRGLAAEPIAVRVHHLLSSTATAGIQSGFGVDSTTVSSADEASTVINAGAFGESNAVGTVSVSEGYHYIQALETGGGAGTQSWYKPGDGYLTAMTGLCWC